MRHHKMKLLYNLTIILISLLVLSPCTCLPTLGHNRSNSIQCIDTERDALLQFKHGITNDPCELLTSWKSHTDCCQWGGVLCSNITGLVVSLSLEGKQNDGIDVPCLQGKVGPSLGELKHLEHLNLSNNNFYGEVPHQLGNLSMLTILDLNYAYDYGVSLQSLSWISRLNLLRYLDLSGLNLSDVTNWMTIINNLHSLRVLHMDGCQLPTRIPSSLSYVNSSTTLHTISLSNNHFKDNSIFQWLFNLPKITTKLVHLDLSSNYFGVNIPSELANLSKLTTLDLSYAYDGAPVQSLSWISRLTLLRYLDLSGANLSEVTNWMTIINNFHSLRVLSMDGCQLPTRIPSSLSYVNSSTTLHTIILSDNYFKDDSIFQWLFNLPKITTQLVHLDLSFNNYKVTIPSEFENFHNLLLLNLEGNGFQGSVSKIISKLCNLEQLNLAYNNFTDELSNVIHSLVKCNNKALLTLDLSFNRFWGGIPDNIGSLSSLRRLYLTNNQLKGEINPSIRHLTMLETLAVSSNFLEGTLTSTLLSNFVSLVQLILSDNLGLVISIEEDWIPPFNLETILLRFCKLGPRFPKWLQLQTNFAFFDVSNTGISDSIPVSFWNSLSSNLYYLNMSNNQLYGTLPHLPHILLNPFAIDLSSNLFEGVVPSGFANSSYLFLNDNRFSNCSNLLCPNAESNLEMLDLSNNLFYGELPDCWMHFSQLRSLHLENNRFSGSMPKSISTLSGLQYLYLYNNSFSGPFPFAFESLTSLVILNLGYNLFTGYMPPWIGNSSHSLGALILRNNHFMGEIPESICQLKNLQILDLANNHFSGVIPHCIGTFMAMEGIRNLGQNFELDAISFRFDVGATVETRIETAIVSWKGEEQRFKETIRFVKYIDLSSNELSGEIPDGILSLTALGALDLSQNKLSGNIPSEIGNLSALELLDLSNNHLTGKIPISLAKVTTLDVMNVSNNNLSGEIPVSTQLQSFDASSYAGNPELCGAPLPSCLKDRVPNGDITSVQKKDDDFGFFLGLYISVVLGFIVGFWGVCGTLVIKTSWRHAYFRLLDKIKDRIM